MKVLKQTILALSLGVALGGFADAVPVVTDASMVQPSGTREVTITYTLSEASAVVTLDIQTNATDGTWASIGGEKVQHVTGDVWKPVAVGTRTIKWQPDLSWPDHRIASGGARAVVTAWALDNTPDYMVVDISAAAQADTQKYYPSVEFLPGGLLGNDDYRTTSVVMRKIMAKDVTWTMGSTALETKRSSDREATHKVTLTNNYYIGVFPVTQAQYAQVTGSYPSKFSSAADRAMRPLESENYNWLRSRNDTSTYWPNAPHNESFLGVLRTRTGIDFDFPSEAQWEFAARAGNGDTKWGDGSGILNEDADANLARLGRYRFNGGYVQNGTSYSVIAQDPWYLFGATNGTAIVGSYSPNAWGLYDMFGNVYEYCNDWYEKDISAHDGKMNVDPANPANTLSGTKGGNRVGRGGSHSDVAGWCRPSTRNEASQSWAGVGQGCRLYCTAGLR